MIKFISIYANYYRTIGKLAFPLFLGQLGNIAVGFADNIMVGHYSTDALASASFVNNFFTVTIFACVGFTYGLTPLIGALFARNDNDSIGRITRTGLWVNTVFTLLIAAVMLGIYFCLDSFGQPEHLMPLIRPYYLIVLAGMLPVTIFNVLAQWSFAINDTAVPTWIVLAANAFNILFNYILIFGHFGAPELGLTGAGISTLGARIICAVAMAWVFFSTRRGRPFLNGFFHAPSRRGNAALVARTGFPVAIQMACETAAFSGSAIMAGWIGRDALAAFQIVAISGMLGFCIYYSIGAAMAIPVSHAAGRGDTLAMRRSARAGYHLILAAMLVTCSLFIFGGRHIMGLFTTDEAVLTLALTLILPMVLYQFGDATQITFANALRGTSHVMPMLYIAIASYLVVGLPCTYILAFPAGLGMYGIVLSFSVSLLMAGALYFWFFVKALRAVDCSRSKSSE